MKEATAISKSCCHVLGIQQHSGKWNMLKQLPYKQGPKVCQHNIVQSIILPPLASHSPPQCHILPRPASSIAPRSSPNAHVVIIDTFGGGKESSWALCPVCSWNHSMSGTPYKTCSFEDALIQLSSHYNLALTKITQMLIPAYFTCFNRSTSRIECA